MKVTRALQRNRFLRIRENYNVSVKINGGISRGQSMGKEREEFCGVFFAYITINRTFFPANFYVTYVV